MAKGLSTFLSHHLKRKGTGRSGRFHTNLELGFTVCIPLSAATSPRGRSARISVAHEGGPFLDLREQLIEAAGKKSVWSNSPFAKLFPELYSIIKDLPSLRLDEVDRYLEAKRREALPPINLFGAQIVPQMLASVGAVLWYFARSISGCIWIRSFHGLRTFPERTGQSGTSAST